MENLEHTGLQAHRQRETGSDVHVHQQCHLVCAKATSGQNPVLGRSRTPAIYLEQSTLMFDKYHMNK